MFTAQGLGVWRRMGGGRRWGGGGGGEAMGGGGGGREGGRGFELETDVVLSLTCANCQQRSILVTVAVPP